MPRAGALTREDVGDTVTSHSVHARLLASVQREGAPEETSLRARTPVGASLSRPAAIVTAPPRTAAPSHPIGAGGRDEL